MEEREYHQLNRNEVSKVSAYESTLKSVAKFIREKLSGNRIRYVSNSYDFIFVFNETNLMHLTGLKHINGATMFFEQCLSGNINYEQLLTSNFSATQQKLSVINVIELLFDKDIKLCGSGQIGYIKFDGMLSPISSSLIPLKNKKNYYQPISLLRVKISDIKQKPEKVYLIEVHKKDNSIIKLL